MSVGLGIIEKIYTRIVSGGHTLDSDLLTNLAAICDPCAQR
jgi:hypothetical protein